MASYGDPPVNGSLGYVAPSTNYYPFQLQPQPCPICHRCPTCGSYRPAPYTYPNTWTTETVKANGTDQAIIWNNPNATATTTTVPSSFIPALAEEQSKQQMQLAQTTAVNCAADCSHDD